ncbi:uncharacterized membrane protein (DUF106 family) [Enterococcus sp. PF1-24]|uniref:tetratricopeptide repeat protein n=1 Tax=unclassified Enterococcus TaxID=2608891 RepID=UPI002476B290|nr:MULTISPECIES: tetratricopeptide repeat protein [unclassified Enterococcus]MDH6363744.1 uncharacterized membrane protein (DUF106 family) [Enterococcus sp. PFB1-1]MDH6400700.1 uncharacterized membrane protein (DUF106 family) [Enterococcus sp. PF1-24]
MFGFFKKKEKKVVDEIVEEKLSEEKIQELQQKVQALESKIQAVQTEQPEEKNKLAQLLEEQGLIYAVLGENDQAILTLECSLTVKQTIGDGYKKLMSLYNSKRAESARYGDDQGIDYYMSKMDEMRQIAKKVTISG